MAKYDTYSITLHLGTEEDQARLQITVLLEDGDNPAEVIEDARELLRNQALAMKESKFLKEIAQ